jgi:hypothetical protein
VWAKVNKCIVDNDIPAADREKKVVEQEQRKRIQERKEQKTFDQAKYFRIDENGYWVFKRDQFDITRYFTSTLPEKNSNHYRLIDIILQCCFVLVR